MADYSRSDGRLGLFLDVDAFILFLILWSFWRGEILISIPWGFMYSYASITKWIIPEIV